MCGDRLANFLSVPTAHSFRRASVGSRTGAVQSWQSARLASLRRRGFSHQSTHGPPKKHPTAFELPQIVRTIRKKPPVVEDIKF